MQYEPQSEMPLLEGLRALYPDSSRRTLQNWLKSGRFSLNGKVIKEEKKQLQKGDLLTSQETFRPPRIPQVPILFEDRFIIAIDKPVGLLSTPLDEEASNKKHALGMLREYYETDQIFAVHRIDRETSGVLLFARGKQSAERLGAMFEAHDLKRRYSAIIEGNLKEDSGTWSCPLLELPNLNVVESSDGKMAITHFEVYRRSSKYTYLNLTLETGKKHQIRAHCKRAGHPVVGDQRYGSKENPLRRLCLHARSIEFVHPFTKKVLYIESPLHKSFQVLGGQIIHDKSKRMF